jgi:hypothetical protein
MSTGAVISGCWRIGRSTSLDVVVEVDEDDLVLQAGVGPISTRS